MAPCSKLVRDKIPEIIGKSDKTPHYKELDQKRYFIELKKKLNEEVLEYFESESSEELADILEVVYALAKEQKVSPSQLEQIRQTKRQQRGGFEKRILLIETLD